MKLNQKLNRTQTLSSSLKTLKTNKPVVRNYFQSDQKKNILKSRSICLLLT